SAFCATTGWRRRRRWIGERVRSRWCWRKCECVETATAVSTDEHGQSRNCHGLLRVRGSRSRNEPGLFFGTATRVATRGWNEVVSKEKRKKRDRVGSCGAA